jgi:hypothetical protein
MNLEFKRLNEIDCTEIVALNTNPLVMRQMPLNSRLSVTDLMHREGRTSKPGSCL